MQIIKPQKLQKGDRVAVVSPSYAEAKTMPNRLQQSFVFLKSLGLEPTLMPHALEQDKDLPYLSASPKDRAYDINQAFADSSIKAIFCTVGGENCNALLPFLDYELIKKNPKIFMGFSDITVLLLAIFQKTGLVTFHGPNLLFTWGSVKNPPAYSVDSLTRMIFDGKNLIFRPAPHYSDISFEYTDEVLDEFSLNQKGEDWEFIKKGRAEGKLLGGGMESIQHLRQTDFWPNFKDTILFLEECDETVALLHQWLTNLRLSRVFDQIQGMIVGKIADKCKVWDDQPQDLGWDEGMFKKMLLAATDSYNFPILTEVDLGHTRPMLTLPIGIEARINMDGTIELLEEAVI